MNDAYFDPNFDYDGFAKRLAEAIFPEKPTAFSERSGVPQGTLFKYLKGQGQGPRLDIVAKLAKAANTSIDWLVYAEGDGPADMTGIVRIPRFDATLAAGCGSWNEGRRQVEDFPLSASFVRERLRRTSVAGLFVLQGRGDSMEPAIQDGAPILIDGNDRKPDDDVFAFVFDGDARVKRFRKLMDGVMLISDNPAYPPETVTGQALSKLEIIGRALLTVHIL